MKNLHFSVAFCLGIVSITYSQTVTIGTQVWMTKNLDASTFRNGDSILQAKTEVEWKKAGENKQPAWCYHNNDPSIGGTYGKLYNWYAVNDPRGLAPAGWHVPSSEEWETLIDKIGWVDHENLKSEAIYETKTSYIDEAGYYETKWVACNKCYYWSEKQKANNPCTACRNLTVKEIKTGKYIPKTKRKIEEKIQIGGWNGTNKSGFSALPGGSRYNEYGFFAFGVSGWWWTSTNLLGSLSSERPGGGGDPADYAFECQLYKTLGPNVGIDNKNNGNSVRCIKD